MSVRRLPRGTVARRRKKRFRVLRIKLDASPVFRGGKTGKELRDEGMRLALDNEMTEWRLAFYEIVQSLPYGRRMTGEQINAKATELIGLPHDDHVWGAVTYPCVMWGWLHDTGDRPKMKKKSSHAQETPRYITGWHKRPPGID